MNSLERIQLNKMIDANNVQDCTADIRAKKHSEKIKEDVDRLIHLKTKYARLRQTQPKMFDSMCVSQCNFLFNNYTDIFNKVKKDELNLDILGQLLTVLKQIEDGHLDQHTGAYEVGKIMQRIYIDSALMRNAAGPGADASALAGAGALAGASASGADAAVAGGAEPAPIKKISWREYKMTLEPKL
jgi:hypothetical protein